MELFFYFHTETFGPNLLSESTRELPNGSRTFRTIDVSPPKTFRTHLQDVFHPRGRDDLPQFKTFRPPVRRFAPTEDVSPPMWDVSPPIWDVSPPNKTFGPSLN